MFLSKRKYAKIVTDAYATPHGPAHKFIIRKFKAWMGSERAPFRLKPSKKFQHYIRKAVRRMAEDVTDPDLGFHGIGFGDLKIRCSKTDTTSATVYLFGMSDNYPIFKIYEKYIRPGSTAIDIGANIGMHALVMAKLCGDKGKVYAFEPSVRIYSRLLENIRENRFDNVNALNKAVGNETGEVGFDDNSSNANIGTSHVDRLLSTKVPIIPLDEEIPQNLPVSLIKIDVEGLELEVIKGAAHLLSTNKPIAVLEFNPKDYTLTELIKTFPYPVHMYVIGYHLAAKTEPIVINNAILRNLQRQCNLLICPVDNNAISRAERVC